MLCVCASQIKLTVRFIALAFQYKLRGGFCPLFFESRASLQYRYCLISSCSCCPSTFRNRNNASPFFSLHFGVFLSLFSPLLLCRLKLLPEEERRRENMAESGDACFLSVKFTTQAALLPNTRKKRKKKGEKSANF